MEHGGIGWIVRLRLISYTQTHRPRLKSARYENGQSIKTVGKCMMRRATVCLIYYLWAAILIPQQGWSATSADTSWPKRVLGHGANGVPFVDNRVCQPCHAQAFEDWRGSHHDQAMQAATEATVLGDFRNAQFTHQGRTSRFFTREGKFFVHTEGPDGQMADFEVQYTFGVDPLQQYLIPLPGGRLQSLSIAWDVHKQRWFHLYPDEHIKPGDPLHWTGLYQTWNSMCAECHSTDLNKQYDPQSQTYQTTWSEVNVSCQACHGPGGRHVDWANRETIKPDDLGQANASQPTGLVVDFAKLDGPEQVAQCARCHSRRRQVSANDQHGRSWFDDFEPETLRAGLYHADGQILDEVYVYGSYVQSKMYRAGVRCTDCHQPHTLKLRAEGNALCVQCHQSQPDKRFTTLAAKVYDTPDHHFHPMGSIGAQCVNCHMPATTYMRIDPRRDHSIRVPRPDLSVKLGTPDACTGCHLGKSPAWAADTIDTWYGTQRAPHFAETLALGRAGQPETLSQLAPLAANTAQPAIVRATALELLRQYGAAGLQPIIAALHDDDPMVRIAAVGGLDDLPPQARLSVIAPALRDPLRAVRSEAARALASVPAQSFTAQQQQDFKTAVQEFTEAQIAMSDTPAAHMNLALLQDRQGQAALAEDAYLTALHLDPAFLPAHVNLANFYNRLGRHVDAERVLRQALSTAPEEGELHYSLGLLLAEMQRLEEAEASLGKAARLLPARARVRYNHGLALQHLGRRPEAETALRSAHELAPTDTSILQAVIIFYAQGQQWDQAERFAEQLVRLHPQAPGPQQMLQQIQQQKNR